MPRDARPATRPVAPKRPRPASAPDADLFGAAAEAAPEPASEPARGRTRRHAVAAPAVTVPAETVAPTARQRRAGRKAASGAPPEPDANAAESEAAPVDQADPTDTTPPFDTTPAAASGADPVATPVDTADPARLHPDELLLQRVDPRSFRPGERGDSWLYWLTDRDRAQDALRDGLLIEPGETLLLSDRPAVLPQLAILAEDPDFAPAAIAVLRLKRIAVEPFLAGGPRPNCYLLTADAKPRS